MDSGFTALIVGSVPIWASVLEAFLNRRRPSWRLVCGLLLGFAGLMVLLIPILQMGGRSDVLSVIALIIATNSWVYGAVLQARRPMGLKPMVSSCWQQLLRICCVRYVDHVGKGALAGSDCRGMVGLDLPVDLRLADRVYQLCRGS